MAPTFCAASFRQRRAGLRPIIAFAYAAAAVLAYVGQDPAFVPPRRVAVLGGALPTLLGPLGASAAPRVTDRAVYTNSQKVELVPVFKQGMDYLEKYGVDDRMLLFLPRMVRKMEIYATCFSATEAPDKTVRRLEKDAEAFKKAVMAKDKEAAIQAFEVYRLDIPKGVGSFDLAKPSTYEAPPP